jgi:plastocyanin
LAFAFAAVAACQASDPGALAATAAPKPVTRTVVIEGTAYAPASLTVRRGDTVVWVNKDPFPHTATAQGAFDSQGIPAGKSWRLTTRTTGEFAYICTFHPNMKATLVVR